MTRDEIAEIKDSMRNARERLDTVVYTLTANKNMQEKSGSAATRPEHRETQPTRAWWSAGGGHIHGERKRDMATQAHHPRRLAGQSRQIRHRVGRDALLALLARHVAGTTPATMGPMKVRQHRESEREEQVRRPCLHYHQADRGPEEAEPGRRHEKRQVVRW